MKKPSGIHRKVETLIFEKALYPIAVLLLLVGISGIVEDKSPQNLATIGTLGKSFIAYFHYHSLILGGALLLTFAVWFSSNHH